ncbi:MAG: DNA-binding protein WhiA [Ruminococcaceae bacterium]|nr:DNA-binding protein WhiA [Oscillospiraceae bacterium]
MSFSTDVKKELCKCSVESNCCNKAELAAIVSFCGTVVTRPDGNALRIRTENFNVAKRTQRLFHMVFGYNIDITERAKRRGGSTFTMYIYEASQLFSVANKLGLLVNKIIKFNINPFIVQEECCKRAYLRGAFLGGGSVTSPLKSYHFELETHYQGLSRDLIQLLYDMDIDAKTVTRKSLSVIYIKESEVIADLIALMGATDAMIELLNVKMEKDYKNNINRQVNCETANLKKQGDAAAKQIFAIKKLMADKRVNIPDQLRELASVRIEYPEASLKELGELLNPPISKSGVNHRLKKLIEMAEKCSDAIEIR